MIGLVIVVKADRLQAGDTVTFPCVCGGHGCRMEGFIKSVFPDGWAVVIRPADGTSHWWKLTNLEPFA